MAWTPPDGRPVSFGQDAAHILRDRFSGLRRRVAARESGTFWVMTLSVPFVVVRAALAPPSGVITLVWSDGESLEALLQQPLAVKDLDAWIEAFTRLAADPPQLLVAMIQAAVAGNSGRPYRYPLILRWVH